jgi:dienelactone hydrolase
MIPADCPGEVPVRVLEERRVGAIRVFYLRYLSHEIEGEPLWVYAVLGVPDRPTGALPGLLHLHGGLQTASEETVRHFAARGYAVLSFDWFGPTAERPAGITTVFPAVIPQIDDRTVSLERARIHHVVRMARRGLSLLAARPEVRGGRLGVMGISWGGIVTWLLNALDSRVRAAIPVFGCGFSVEPMENERAWFAAYQPEHFAARQLAPVLYLNGTNDLSGFLPMARKLFDDIPVEKRTFLGPNENHGLWPETLLTASNWLDHYLKDAPALPPGPVISVRCAVETAHVTGVAEGAEAVEVYFSYGTDTQPPGGFWHEARTAGRSEFSAVVPLWRGVRRLEVLALARYPDGSVLTGFPESVDVAGMVPVGAPEKFTRRLYAPEDGISPWFSQWRWRRTEILPIEGRLEVSAWNGPGNAWLRFIPGKTPAAGEPVFALMLRSPGCSLVEKAGIRSLEVELLMPEGGSCEVTASAAGINDSFEAAAT